MKEAEQALDDGDYQKHVQLLEERAARGDGDALDALGKLYAAGRIVDFDRKKAHELFEKGYAAGSLSAACHLGWCFEYGVAVAKNPPKARELWELADRKGFACAPLFLSNYYSDKQDYIKAIELIKQSISRDCVEGSYELSHMYANGLGVEKDLHKAQELCAAAAMAGSKRAIYTMAYNYQFGKSGLPIDHELAKQWAEKGCLKGDADCQTLLADMYLYGSGAQRNTEKGLELYRKAVEQRHPWALWCLGKLYERGRFVERSETKARELFQLAAERDYGPAQNELGNIIQKGTDGTKPDPKSAFALYLKAAQKGLDYAQYNAGKALQDGNGVPRDSKTARLWYEAAIKQGNPHACNQLSLMYLRGTTDGITQNEEEGVRLRIKGANLGCPFAQSNLASNYEHGKHFKKDMKKALYWYQKSADQNMEDWVPNHLGELYERGKGVPQNKQLAINYYERAAKLGNESAKRKLQELKRATKPVTPAG